MVSSISSAGSGNIQQLMAEMYKKLGAADTDGTAGLSKSEISSVDAGSDVGGAAFLKSLTAQFGKIDTDGNGQLSDKEISSAKPQKGAIGPMGPPPGMKIEDLEQTEKVASTSSTSSTDATNSASSNVLEELIAKLLESMAEKLNKTDSEGSSTTQNPLASLSASADTDGVSGLSMQELSSVGTSNDAAKANFINNLMKNFETIDSDANGQLSQSELEASKPNSAPQATAVQSIENSLSKISDAFIQKALTSYQNGGLSSLTSSLNIAG